LRAQIASQRPVNWSFSECSAHNAVRTLLRVKLSLIVSVFLCYQMLSPSMKTQLVTREGYNKLRAEHDHLWNEKRPEVTKIVSWAASLGDRSENADYTYNKRLLRQIDRRVRYLRKCLADLKIVDYAPQQEGKVFFGAWVQVENEQGDVKRFRIVGPDEIYGDTMKDYISIDSPMARALIKKEVDDEVVVNTPEGQKVWFVNRIDYVKDAQ